MVQNQRITTSALTETGVSTVSCTPCEKISGSDKFEQKVPPTYFNKIPAFQDHIVFKMEC